MATSETTGQTPARRASRLDPRIGLGLSDRDLQVVGWLATVPFAAQYHVHHQFFADTSDVPVSRCVRRLHRLGLLAIHRWNGVGMNLLHLTAAGRDLALQHTGRQDDEVFVGRFPTVSALPHTLWILDTLLAAGALWPKSTIYPCWRVRRLLAGTKSPVPDLLVASPSRKRIIAFEIDLATENLRRVLLPRLEVVRGLIPSWGAADAATGIIVLTSGERRRQSIEAQLPPHAIPVVTGLLPKPAGRPTIGTLRDLLTAL